MFSVPSLYLGPLECHDVNQWCGEAVRWRNGLLDIVFQTPDIPEREI